MDDRPRQILKQLLAQYGPALCDHPGRCRGLLLDSLRGACEAESNALFLTLQYGMVQELRMAVGTRPPELLLEQLVQKLRTRMPLDETATRWAIEAWAAALGIPLPVPSPLASSSSPPLPTPSPTWRNSIGMEFVLIQPGEFSMGSRASEAYNNERPAHTVRLTNAFYLGKYEVTEAQWNAVMETEKPPVESRDAPGDLNRSGRNNLRPMANLVLRERGGSPF
jgi:formylglycine-generating enzyme required for sulfatase activity